MSENTHTHILFHLDILILLMLLHFMVFFEVSGPHNHIQNCFELKKIIYSLKV